MKKKKNADVVETEAAEAVTEETKTSEDKKPETETTEDIEKKAEEEAAEIEAYDAEGNPILKKKKKRIPTLIRLHLSKKPSHCFLKFI